MNMNRSRNVWKAGATAPLSCHTTNHLNGDKYIAKCSNSVSLFAVLLRGDRGRTAAKSSVV